MTRLVDVKTTNLGTAECVLCSVACRAKLAEAMSRLNRVSVAYKNGALESRSDNKENLSDTEKFGNWLAERIGKQ